MAYTSTNDAKMRAMGYGPYTSGLLFEAFFQELAVTDWPTRKQEKQIEPEEDKIVHTWEST